MCTNNLPLLMMVLAIYDMLRLRGMLCASYDVTVTRYFVHGSVVEFECIDSGVHDARL